MKPFEEITENLDKAMKNSLINVKRNGSVFIHALDEIPCLEELYDYYLGYFKKKLLYGKQMQLYLINEF